MSNITNDRLLIESRIIGDNKIIENGVIRR